MKEYGYCRVSTDKQNIERQERNIRAAYPNAIIIKETYTGTTAARPKFERLLKQIEGQTDVRIIFDSVSRMSRNAEEGFALYEQLYRSGVDIVFLKDPQINTATYRKSLDRSLPETGTKVDIILDAIQAFLIEIAKEQIKIAFEQSQKEVDDLRQRTREGIETARLHGKQIGQQVGRKFNVKNAARCKEIIRKHSKDFDGSLNDVDCIKLCGCARNSFYKYKGELKAALKEKDPDA